MSRGKFFRGRRTQRRGELFHSSKPDLTNNEETYTLIHIKDDTSIVTNLGVYTSFSEAEEALQQSIVEAGMLHIFTDDNRVLYSEKREV